jgi:DNA repair photolyase
MATSPNLAAASSGWASFALGEDLLRQRPARECGDPKPSLFPLVPFQRDTEQPASLSRCHGEMPSRDSLVGIARLAADSPIADAKRGTEYHLLPVKSILNYCNSDRVPFRWTVNPYRGCEFGCKYCYARYTHEYMELDGGDFERKIYAKQNVGPLMARDLSSEKIWGEHIAIGTATDPYQPAEREFGATRAILQEIARREGLSVSITTKSNQVVRDLELLQKISARSRIYINMTVTTLRPRLARMLEPRAPRPDLRLEAVRALRAAGIAVGVNAMPILPGLTDREPDLDAVARAAAEAGAQWFAGSVLFLMPSSLKQFMPFIEEKFPKLAKRYHEWYGRAGYAPHTYRAEMTELVRRLRAKYNLSSHPTVPDRKEWTSPQLSLQLDACSSDPRPTALW